jgi:hypothetical protein
MRAELTFATTLTQVEVSIAGPISEAQPVCAFIYDCLAAWECARGNVAEAKADVVRLFTAAPPSAAGRPSEREPLASSTPD